ncbi:MAG: CBS domain-containing protein [Candidatus Altiarchaeota archaeon]
MAEKNQKDVKKSIQAFYDAKVDSFMSRQLPLIGAKSTVGDVLHRMGNLSTDHLWVIDSEKGDKFVGVITEKDILRGLSSPYTSEDMEWDILGLKSITYGSAKTAGDIMSKHIITAKSSTTVGEVIRLMTQNRIRRLPVVDRDKLIGEVTVHQIAGQVSKNLLKK